MLPTVCTSMLNADGQLHVYYFMCVSVNYAWLNLLDPGFLGDFTAFQDMGQYNAQLN